MENINQQLPADLMFVAQKNISVLDTEMNQRVQQETSVRKLQKKFTELALVSGENLSREETIKLYGIDARTLFRTFQALEKRAKEIGIDVEYTDLTGFSEDSHYENTENEETKHAETARSDGKILLLERDLNKAGGLQGRMYDLLHLAFGHMVQWSTDDVNMLLTKEQAWSIGYRNHEKSPDMVIDMMSLYEFEAGMMAIEVLQDVLENAKMSEVQKEAILQYFVDYVYADRDYIMQHYRGNHESFQKFWQFGKPIPPRRNFPKVESFIKRHAVEIGLIKDKQKQ